MAPPQEALQTPNPKVQHFISTRTDYHKAYSHVLSTKKRLCKKAAQKAKSKCAHFGWGIASFTWRHAGFSRKIRIRKFFRRKASCAIRYTCRYYTLIK